MAMNMVPYGLHNAMMVMMIVDMHDRGRLRLRADADKGSQGNGGSKNQIFHFEPLKHLGEYAAR